MVHRVSVEPVVRLSFGPFPVPAALVAVTTIFALVGALVLALVLAPLTRAPDERSLACRRAGDVVTCEERSEASVRTLRGPASGVKYFTTRQSRSCLSVGDQSTCGVERASVDRIRGLADGERVEVRAEEPRFTIASVVGLLFATMLFVLAGRSVRHAAARRRTIDVVVTPRWIEIGGQPSVARSVDEQLSIVVLSRGRGEIGVWGVAYGLSGTVLLRVPSFDGNRELLPLIVQLQEALASVPSALMPPR